jgi:hypothetical protein
MCINLCWGGLQLLLAVPRVYAPLVCLESLLNKSRGGEDRPVCWLLTNPTSLSSQRKDSSLDTGKFPAEQD